MFKKIGNFIKTILEIAIVSVFLLLAISVVTYKNFGKGLGIASYGEYKTAVISLGDNVSTYILIGEIPEPDDIRNISHKDVSKYNELTDDEKVIYDAILTRSMEIIEGQTNNTEIHVPVEHMNISIDGKSYEEIKAEINSRIRDVDYKKVFKALHRDYEYLMWWEYDMNWEYSEADIKIEDGNLSKTSFKLIVSPAYCFKEDESTIKMFYVERASNAYQYAKEIADSLKTDDTKETLTNFKNWIVKNLDYDDSVVDLMYNNVDSEKVVLSRNFINAFDDNNDTGAICGGYTNAFQVLCDISGVDAICLKTEGKMVSDTKTTDHAWNLVLYDDKFYLADVTNSDEGTVGQKGQLFLKEIYHNDEYDIKMPSGTIYTYYED